jgi:hypothetical protein
VVAAAGLALTGCGRARGATPAAPDPAVTAVTTAPPKAAGTTDDSIERELEAVERDQDDLDGTLRQFD